MIIDAHIHSDCRPVEDFENIHMAGVKAVVSCAYDPLEMKKSNVCFEHFNRLLNVEKKRVEKNKIKYYLALGIHPRAIPADYEEVLKKLPEYLSTYDNILAIGEIGLEKATALEKEVFIKQLQLADENKYKVIVHTPRTNKDNITDIIIELLDEYIDESLVQLDHVDFSIVDKVIDKKYTPAVTIQPYKMSVNDTVNLFDKYGFDKFIIDSDMSYAPSDPLSLSKLKHELEVNNYNQSNIDKVTFKNFLKFHGIDNLKI